MAEYRAAVLTRRAETPAVPAAHVNITLVVLVTAALLVCVLSCGAMGVSNPPAEKGKYVRVGNEK
jgi:hypothetical protein